MTALRFSIASAALVALLAMGLATSVSAAERRTVVTFVVSGCEGCTIGATRILDDGDFSPSPDDFAGARSKVRGGVAVFNVPTKYTRGMTFSISQSEDALYPGGNAPAGSNIILGDARPAGTTLSSTQAKKTRLATTCWAGTTRPTAAIHVDVKPAITHDGGTFYVNLRAWASPTVATVGPLYRSPRGLALAQDVITCRVP